MLMWIYLNPIALSKALIIPSETPITYIYIYVRVWQRVLQLAMLLSNKEDKSGGEGRRGRASSSFPYIVRSFGLLGLFGLPNGVAVTHPVRETCPCLSPSRLPCASCVRFLHPLRTADGVVPPLTWSCDVTCCKSTPGVDLCRPDVGAGSVRTEPSFGFNPSQ